MLLLSAGFLCAGAWGAQTPGGMPPAPQAKNATPADYVGAETCTSCHEEAAKEFSTNPHNRMALEDRSAWGTKTGRPGITCENCHGPGREHVEGGGDKTKIFNPAKAAAKDVDARCLGCHAASHPNFLRSPHAKANVSCISCHDIHKSVPQTTLLKAEQPALCFQCHSDVKPAFDMPFHHRVNEGLVKCSDCHDTHGSFLNSNLRSTADRNEICTKCHTETRGPFVYEHPAVKAEGCVSCHTPHGSQNARLLNMPNINTLCNQCHSPVANRTVHGMGAGSTELAPCTSCHAMIHGSNIDPFFKR